MFNSSLTPLTHFRMLLQHDLPRLDVNLTKNSGSLLFDTPSSAMSSNGSLHHNSSTSNTSSEAASPRPSTFSNSQDSILTPSSSFSGSFSDSDSHGVSAVISPNIFNMNELSQLTLVSFDNGQFDTYISSQNAPKEAPSVWDTDLDIMGANSFDSNYDGSILLEEGIAESMFEDISSNINDPGHLALTNIPSTIVPSLALKNPSYQRHISSPLTPPSSHGLSESYDLAPSLLGSGYIHELRSSTIYTTGRGPDLGSVSLTPPRTPKAKRLRKSTRDQKQKSTRCETRYGEAKVAQRAIPCTHWNDPIPCLQKFQRSEHLTRHLKASAHCDERPYVCDLPDCLDKNGDRTAFNRLDNYRAHVVNCHLLHSDKERRIRIVEDADIKALGWDKYKSQMQRELNKRNAKQTEISSKLPIRKKTAKR